TLGDSRGLGQRLAASSYLEMTTDRDVLAHGEGSERLDDLKRAHEAFGREHIGPLTRDVCACKRDRAEIRDQESRDQAEQSWLARAVGADQCGDPALSCGQPDVSNGGQAAESFADVLDLK